MTSVASSQHTPLTSQYLFNGLLINPAYAGSRDALTANLTHRTQWVGMEGAPVTQLISIHAPLRHRKIGLGLLLYGDRIGVSRETGVFTNYAYRIRSAKGTLAFGIGAGITALRADWNTVALQQQNDLSFAEPTMGAVRPNFSTGLYYSTRKYFLGVSVPFVLHHSYGIQEGGYVIGQASMNMQPMLTGGRVLDLDRDWKLKPTLLLRYRHDSGVQADISTNAIYRERIWLGVSYRTGDAVIGMLEVLPTPQWRVGYAYDLGLSPIRRYHHGSHEVMVQYEFGYRIRVRDPRHF